MICVPETIQSQYDEYLVRSGLAGREHVDYRRWLRYYWDFCTKYGHERLALASLSLFMGKLASKGQSEAKRGQASKAVDLYWSMLREQRDSRRTITAAGAVAAGHHVPDSTPVRAMPSQVKKGPQNDVVPPADPIPRPADRASAGRKCEPVLPEPAPGTTSPTGASWVREYDELRNAIRLRNYSPRTLATYRHWMRKFQAFTESKCPGDLTVGDVKAFLTDLAVAQEVSASTQNQAFNALLFFFRHVLGREFGKLDGVVRAKRRGYIPVVLSRDEVDRILASLSPPYSLVVKLLYGCGLRISECLELRVHNLNLDEGILTIHDGKGQKDRTVPLPTTAIPEIRDHLQQVWQLHREDLEVGYGGVFLPSQLEKKYRNAPKDYIWQWIFSAKRLSRVAATGELRRYHMQGKEVHRALKQAVAAAAITKRVTPHTFRHSFASHLLQANYDIRTIQELLGHSDVKTTMIYAHTVPSRTLKERRSPLDL